MELIDSHCHLDFARIGDLDCVLAQSNESGINQFVVPSVDKQNWRDVLRLAKNYRSIHAALGVHPYFISADNELEQLQRLLISQRDHIVAVGEIGLDGAIESSLEQQLAVFVPQLKMACELELPVICHAHKAYDPLLKQLRLYRPNAGGVIHGFSGSLVQANEFIKLGFKLGIGGVITYERAKKTRLVISQIALEHLVLETDSPDMPVFGQQGHSNSPKHILTIAKCLANITSNSLADVADMTTNNAQTLFNL